MNTNNKLDNKKSNPSIIRVAFNVGYYLIMSFLIVALTFSLLSRIESEKSGTRPQVMGVFPTIVASGSMEPNIHVNSLNLVKTCETEDVEVGDIIVYWEDARRINIIHRVIDIQEIDGVRTLTTQGDANLVEDSTKTTNENIIGKVIYIGNWMAPLLDGVIEHGQINYKTLTFGCIVIVLGLFVALMALSALVEGLVKLIMGLTKSDIEPDTLENNPETPEKEDKPEKSNKSEEE